MKELLSVLIFLCSFSSFAAISTSLKVAAEPSTAKIESAIGLLEKAADNKSKSRNLRAARRLIAVTSKKVRFKAAVYVDGNKQFNNRGDEALSWNFNDFCYKGSVSEAVDLINTALKQGHWGSDEEWIDNASANGANIDLKVVDGPNELDWVVSFGACK